MPITTELVNLEDQVREMMHLHVSDLQAVGFTVRLAIRVLISEIMISVCLSNKSCRMAHSLDSRRQILILPIWSQRRSQAAVKVVPSSNEPVIHIEDYVETLFQFYLLMLTCYRVRFCTRK